MAVNKIMSVPFMGVNAQTKVEKPENKTVTEPNTKEDRETRKMRTEYSLNRIANELEYMSDIMKLYFDYQMGRPTHTKGYSR